MNEVSKPRKVNHIMNDDGPSFKPIAEVNYEFEGKEGNYQNDSIQFS